MMNYEIKINDKVIFTSENENGLLETKGHIILFDISVFNFSSLNEVAKGGDYIQVYRNNYCLFSGYVIDEQHIMENTGMFRHDYYCVDIFSEFQRTLLFDIKMKEFKTVSDWLAFFIDEFSKNNKRLSVRSEIKNDLNVEIEIKDGLPFIQLLEEIKQYDKHLTYFLDYEKKELVFTYREGKTITAKMWEQILSVKEDLDATDYKNTSSAISEWIEEIIHWKTVCEWIDGGSYFTGQFDDYNGDTMLMRPLGGEVPSTYPVKITTHVDTAQTTENYKDWVAIFGYGQGIAQPYQNHRGIDFVPQNGERVEMLSPPFWTKIVSWSFSDKDDRGIYIELETVELNGSPTTQKVKRYMIFRYLHFAYLDDRYVGGNYLVPPRTPLGEMGNTGESHGSHAHIDMRTANVWGNWIDPYPYIFNVSNDWGWNSIVQSGRLECHQEIDWIEYVPHKLKHTIYNDEEVKKYGRIECAVRDNEVREQEIIRDMSVQNYINYQNRGFMRTIDMTFTTGIDAQVNDFIEVYDVPFMEDGESTRIVSREINLLEPHLEEITIDTNGFRLMKLLLESRR